MSIKQMTIVKKYNNIQNLYINIDLQMNNIKIIYNKY